MLVIVALPVQLMERTPGPKYSMTRLVPPFTVSTPAEVEDDVLGRGPAAQLAGQAHADQLRVLHLPRQPGHDVDRVRAAHAGGEHAQPAGVGRVRVGADHHPAGEGVVLEHDLVDDPGARLPEADAVLPRGGGEEVVDLAVLLLGRGQVGRRARRAPGSGGRSGRWWARRSRDPRAHELEERHLRGGVLHGHAIGPQLEVALARLELLPRRVVQMAERAPSRPG